MLFPNYGSALIEVLQVGAILLKKIEDLKYVYIKLTKPCYLFVPIPL